MICPCRPTADIRLPRSEHGPLSVLMRRLGLAALLVVIVSLITYLDRDGFRDSSGDPIDLLDAFYFGSRPPACTRRRR